MSDSQSKIIDRSQIAALAQEHRAKNKRIVFTNGCFDILHPGHVSILEQAKALGDFFIVGINSDASVRRLKGESRPINSQENRAKVLSGLQSVDAVCIFEDDTPIPILEDVRPDIHVKGGDYTEADLPEAATVKKHGGELKIIPLEPGHSTSAIVAKQATRKMVDKNSAFRTPHSAFLIIPARYGSTRFPGKPLAQLGGKAVIRHVVEAGLQCDVQRPVLVATDDERIAAEVEKYFDAAEAQAVMTSPNCHTGTDRLAETVQKKFSDQLDKKRLVIVNVQGDEPFQEPSHISALIAAMADKSTLMATLATPIEARQVHDPNVVKVVRDKNGDALYFSRSTIPLVRDGDNDSPDGRLRHLGVYAYEANWLLKMAKLEPTPLEQAEQLEQLRALEHGVKIKVAVVRDVVPIAIDTPLDLERAEEYLSQKTFS